MGSIRKILLINVFGLVIILLAFTSYAGMGGDHHMPSYGGNVIDMPNRNNPDTHMNNQQFNHSPGMHEETGRTNQTDHNFQEGMMNKNYQERNSEKTNNDNTTDNGMNHQHQFDGRGMD